MNEVWLVYRLGDKNGRIGGIGDAKATIWSFYTREQADDFAYHEALKWSMAHGRPRIEFIDIEGDPVTTYIAGECVIYVIKSEIVQDYDHSVNLVEIK